ncbi:hypothetical protein KDL44_02795 [bacterium]|nr:hypothetical protein [bacterium]
MTGYRLLAALCAMLCVLGPQAARAATEWQSLLSEDFSQGEVSFYTGQASEAFYGIDDQSRYVIDGLNTNIDSLSALTKNLYYYYVEAECELIDTRIGEMAFCGLVFHYNKKIPGKLAYYVFYIYGDGYYGAKRVIGDSAEVILPLTRSELIDIDRPNILAVEARGTRFDLYINGRFVDSFTDVRIDGGGFGFYVSQQSRAAFDNFSVKVERRGGGPEAVESPELLEGSSDDSSRAVKPAAGADADEYGFPNIPRDPNRPVYPWEVGVDKSETARRERGDEARERELADLEAKRNSQELQDPPAQPESQPATQQPEDSRIEQAEPLKLDPVQPEVPEQQTGEAASQAAVQTEAGSETQNPPVEHPSEATQQPEKSGAAADESFINVSLPGNSSPPADAPQQAEAGEETASQERSAEEIMRDVRADDDDWSTSAPPYRAPDKPRNDAEGKPAETGSDAEADLKGIELPPLDMARAPGRDASSASESQAAANGAELEEPQADTQAESGTGAETPDSGDADAASAPAESQQEAAQTAEPADGSLSLFPSGKDNPQDRPLADNPPDAGRVLGAAEENPGELKLPASRTANDASVEYDPFEGNPDVQSVYDDFTEQRWPVADGDTSSYRYFGAAYEIDNTKSDTMAISYQQGSFSDARYGVDVEYLGGLDYVGYGIATRFSVRNGSVSYYGMFVSQSGEYLLLRVLDGQETVLHDWSSAPNLSRTLSNRIGMELIGGSIQCIINGEVVATINDDSLQSGGYALLCGPGTSTRFDNLTIKGIVTDGGQ